MYLHVSVDVGALGDETLDYVEMSALTRDEQGRPAVLK